MSSLDRDPELICLLTDLFNEDLSVSEKLDALQMEYKLPVSDEMKKEVAEMCTYTTNVFEKGIEKGETKGRCKEIFLSVQEGDYTVARGAQKLDISEEEFIRQMTEAGYKIPTIA